MRVRLYGVRLAVNEVSLCTSYVMKNKESSQLTSMYDASVVSEEQSRCASSQNDSVSD